MEFIYFVGVCGQMSLSNTDLVPWIQNQDTIFSKTLWEPWSAQKEGKGQGQWHLWDTDKCRECCSCSEWQQKCSCGDKPGSCCTQCNFQWRRTLPELVCTIYIQTDPPVISPQDSCQDSLLCWIYFMWFWELRVSRGGICQERSLEKILGPLCSSPFTSLGHLCQIRA